MPKNEITLESKQFETITGYLIDILKALEAQVLIWNELQEISSQLDRMEQYIQQIAQTR